VLIRVSDPTNPVEAKPYKTLGTVKISIPEQKLLDYAPL